MGKSLRVFDSYFKTVKAPYIMDNGSWKTVHKVWVMNGGTWKESHITPHTSYNQSMNNGLPTTSSPAGATGYWTVPANTKYIKVTILGNGGGGGTANRTNVYWPRNGQESGAPGSNGSTATNYTSTISRADGGDGGNGGKAEVVLEVEKDTVFTYTMLGSPGNGGNQDDSLPNQSQTQDGSGTGNLYLRRSNYDSDRSVTPPTASSPPDNCGPDDGHTDVGTIQRGASGIAGSTISFTGASAVGDNYNIQVTGGAGGAGGYLKAQTRTSWSERVLSGSGDCIFRYWTYLYTITATAGSQGSGGSQSATGGNIVYTNMTGGGGGAGGAGGTATDTFAPGGLAGTGGSIKIETYQGI